MSDAKSNIQKFLSELTAANQEAFKLYTAFGHDLIKRFGEVNSEIADEYQQHLANFNDSDSVGEAHEHHLSLAENIGQRLDQMRQNYIEDIEALKEELNSAYSFLPGQHWDNDTLAEKFPEKHLSAAEQEDDEQGSEADK